MTCNGYSFLADSRNVLLDGDNFTCINTTTANGRFRREFAVPYQNTQPSFLAVVLVGKHMQCGTQQDILQLFMNTEMGPAIDTCQTKKMKRCRVCGPTLTSCHFECYCILEFGGCKEALVRKSLSGLPQNLEQLCEILFGV